MRDMNVLVGKKKKNKLWIWILIFLVLISVGSYYIYEYKFKNNNKKEVVSEQTVGTPKVIPQPEPVLQIFKGENRPIAVMIDNETGAWPQAGLQDAYMIYEIIIEGGQTRMMAIFKDKEPTKVGPIRSSRHYFVEYAMEQGAIYAHFGWSPKAEATIKTNNVNNINGMFYDGGKFWREGSGYHTSFTNVKNLREIATDSKYLTISKSEPEYKYSVKEYNLETGKEVESLILTYSPSRNTSYVYDSDKKVFMRSMNGEKHTDRVTKDQYFAKNIIVIKVNNYTMNSSGDKGRQEIENKGTGTGYYLTNGKVIDITWSKKDINSKTYLYDLEGKEIILNDGLTFMQVVPTGNSVNIKYKEVPVAPATTVTTTTNNR